MKKGLLFFGITLYFVVTVLSANLRSKKFDSNAIKTKKSAPTFSSISSINSHTYRSPGDVHKIIIETNDRLALAQAKSTGAVEIADYGSYKLFATSENSLAVLEQRNSEFKAAGSDLAIAADENQNSQLDVRDDLNVLLLRSGVIDTTQDEKFLGIGKSLTINTTDNLALQQQKDIASRSRLRLIQFAGPIKEEWLAELHSTGAEIIAYVPSNGYLIRENSGTSLLLAQAISDAQRRDKAFIQWEGEFKAEYKIHPGIIERAKEGGEITVAVQIAQSKDKSATRDVAAVKQLAKSIIADAYSVLNFINLKITVDASSIAEIAALENVVNIETWAFPQLNDERAGQIIAGKLKNDGKEPDTPGYLNWLQSQGLATRFNFAIDVSDSGMDRGSTQPANLHRDFLDALGQSRVVYARDYTSDLDASDIPGHGTLNLSIAGGYNNSTETVMRDSSGYNYGLGIAPFVSLGASKIFKSDGRFGLSEPFTKLISEAYKDGARISSNSWGAALNAYSLDAQEYDLRARDAIPTQAGNQEILLCFAAGNSGGPRSIGSPGTAKNVLSVGATENVRKGGVDGCGVKDDGADDATEMAFFSSQGPLDDGRFKPEIVAPGSHMQGAATQHADFDGSGVCGGPGITDLYFPLDQKLYTWSSGTSHSTPVVAGAAALTRQYFLNRGEEPSAALIKAMLLSTTTYLGGDSAKGNLPHPKQGWGLLNLGRLFDNTAKVFVNQTQTFSDSGQEFVLTGEIKDSSQPFRVTLAWTDAPGFSAFASWVNDLDLEITLNGQIYRGNNLILDKSQPGGAANTKDNVESVWLPSGTTGPFVIRIRASNIAGDGVPNNSDTTDQDFALAIYNAERKEVPVSAIANVNVAGGADSVADPGENVSLRVNLKDVSPVAMNGASGVLTSSTPGVTVSTPNANFANIAAGGTGENTTPFVANIGSSIACGSTLQFTLEVTVAGTSVSRIPFAIKVGNFQPAEVFADNIENGEAKWTHASGITNKKKKKKGLAIDTWIVSTKRFRSGGNAWFSSLPNIVSDAHLDSVPINLPTDVKNLQLVFYHTFEFEPGGFDGGVIEISVAGADFEDLGTKIIQGRYTAKVFALADNPLGNRDAWIDGSLGAFQQVIVDLSSYAGKSVVIRFRIGTDISGKGAGWFIDDIALRGDRVTCSPVGLQ
jgi:hypothetical protein